jgi:plastocyanin
MRWPYPRFFYSSLTTIVLIITFANLVPSSILDFSPRSVQASSPTYPAAIIDFAFQPQRINVTTGTEVIWRNNGNTQHTVTSSPQTNTTQGGTPLISSGPLNPAQNFSYIFYKHGFYPIQCAFHPATMNGLVNVTGSDVQPPPSMKTTPFDYTPYVIGGVVAGVIVVASIALFVRRRTKKLGTSGSGSQ